MKDEIEAYLPNRLRSWAHPQQWLPNTLEDALIEAASEIESLIAEVERLNKESFSWQDEANRLKTLYNLERFKEHRP